MMSTCRRPSLTLRTPARQVAGEFNSECCSALPYWSYAYLSCYSCAACSNGHIVRSVAAERCCAPAVAGRHSCTVQAVRQRNTSSDRAVQAAEESTEDFQVKLNETIDKLKVSMLARTSWQLVARYLALHRAGGPGQSSRRSAWACLAGACSCCPVAGTSSCIHGCCLSHCQGF